MSILGVKNPLNPAISLVLVQPFVTWEDRGHPIACVGDLNPVQQPTRTDACVIMLNADSKQLAHIQQLNAEAVSAATLKQITELLLQLVAARVTIGPKDTKKDVGICARTLLITCDYNELIGYRDQFARLAGKAFNELGALKGLEVITLGWDGDDGIAAEDVPEDEAQGREQRKKRKVLWNLLCIVHI